MQKTVKRYPFEQLADLLVYPEEGYEEEVKQCLEDLGSIPQASQSLTMFLEVIEELSLGRLQELYTDTFELSSSYTLNTSHHIHEGFDRSRFLSDLNGMYAEHGFSSHWLEEKRDLPDHLSVILEFISHRGDEALDDEEFMDFIEDYLVKSLEAIRKNFEQSEGENPGKERKTPYSLLIEAIDHVIDMYVKEVQ